MKNLEINLIENFKDEYTVFFFVAVFLEIMAKNVDKGYAEKYLNLTIFLYLKLLQWGMAKMTYLLKICGLSVAMGNAMDNVRKVSKYITDTNQNDGVTTKAIRKFI